MSPKGLFFEFIIFIVFFSCPVGSKEINDEDLHIPSHDQIQIISTSDGSTTIGRITRITDETVEYSTEMGIITIPRNRITSIQTILASALREGAYWFPDPNTTRLYFAPTGRMLQKGCGYIADYYLFFPMVNYGVTERLSLGGGFSILPTNKMSDQIFYLTPKYGLKQSERFNIAVGALVMKIPNMKDEDDPDYDEDGSPLASILYGVGTWGDVNRNLTLGFGYGMMDTDLAKHPMVVLGYEHRLTRRFAFVSENWKMPGIDNVLLSYGIRFLTEKFTTDFALINTTGKEAIFPGIPYMDFVYNF